MNEDLFFKNEPEIPEKMPESLKTGFATASFIISMVNFLFFGMAFSFVFSPIAIVLAVIALVRHQGGKAFAITSIIISVISLIISIVFTIFFVKIYPDMEYFILNDTAIISEFEENGSIPERFEKYNAPEYDKYWNTIGCEDFEGFFSFFINSYRSVTGTPHNVPEGEDDGEELVVLGYT